MNTIYSNFSYAHYSVFRSEIYVPAFPVRRQGHDDTYVAFSAGITIMENTTANATVLFDKVFINSGTQKNSLIL